MCSYSGNHRSSVSPIIYLFYRQIVRVQNNTKHSSIALITIDTNNERGELFLKKCVSIIQKGITRALKSLKMSRCPHNRSGPSR